jgi:hypothetical protein
MATSNPTRPRSIVTKAPVDPTKPAEAPTYDKASLLLAPDEIIPPTPPPAPSPKDEVIDIPTSGNPPFGPTTEELKDELGEARKSRAQVKAEKSVKKWLGMGVVAFASSGDMYCASAVATSGKEIADSVGQLAAQFPWLAETLESSDKYAAVVGVVWSLGRLGLTIAAHHAPQIYNNPIVPMLVPNPSKPYPVKSNDGSISNPESAMG